LTSSSAFEDMALLMSLLSPEAKEGCAPLVMRWMGVVAGSQGVDESIKGGGIKWVFEVEVLDECGGLIMESQMLQNQPGSESA